MAVVKSSFKSQSFKYDFAVDGGTIGSKNSGIFLPATCQLVAFTILPLATLTSGGAAIVDIGILGGAFVIDNVVMGKNGDYTDYNTGTWGFGIPTFNITVQPGIMPTNLALTTNGISAQIQTTISAFALTAGAFICTIYYNEF